MPGVGRPRPRPTSPRPRQAPPGQQRPGQPRSAPPARAAPGGVLRRAAAGALRVRTRTRPGSGRPRRRGRRRQGIRATRVPGTELPPGRPGPTPGRHRAGRDRRKTGPRPGGRRERDAPGSKRDTSPLRSGRPPVRPAVPCRPARRQAGAGQYAAGPPWPGQPGPGWPGAGQGPGHSRVPTVRGSRGRPDSPDTGRENLGRGQPGTGRASSPPGSRDPASSVRTKGQGRPAKVSLVRVRSARARARRPWPGRTARRPVRCRMSPARTATPTRTAPDSLAARRCPGSSARTRGTPDPGRPPGRSRDLAGRLAGDRSARTRGAPDPGRPRIRHRGQTGPHGRHRTALAPARPAVGRRRAPGTAPTRGIPARGGPRDPSRDKAGHLDLAAGQAPATRAPGRPPDLSRDPAGHPIKGRVSSARASSARASGTRAPGRPPGRCPGRTGPVQGSSRTRGSHTPVSRILASRIPGQAVPACAIRAGSRASAARSSGSAIARFLTRRRAPRGRSPRSRPTTSAAFARDLRVLRSKGGLDYPDMAEKSHYTMRTLASAAGGLRLPTLPVLIAYVNACGGDVAEWEERWGRLTRAGKKSQGALAAGRRATRRPGGQPGARAYVIPPAARRQEPARSTSSPRPSSATPQW